MFTRPESKGRAVSVGAATCEHQRARVRLRHDETGDPRVGGRLRHASDVGGSRGIKNNAASATERQISPSARESQPLEAPSFAPATELLPPSEVNPRAASMARICVASRSFRVRRVKLGEQSMKLVVNNLRQSRRLAGVSHSKRLVLDWIISALCTGWFGTPFCA